MEQVRLGTTGLHVSRVCLGMMSYGRRLRPAVGARRGGGRADRARGRRGRRHVLRHRRRVLGRRQRGRHGAAAAQAALARRGRRRDEGARPDDAGAERPRAVAQARPVGHRRVAEAARDGLRRPLPDPPLGLRRRRSRRRWRRCTTSSAPARRATSARAACTPGSSRRPSTSRSGTAGRKFVSMQNHYNLVYREEEREMIPQCLDQGVGVIPWSPLARGLLAGTRTRDGERPRRGRRPTRSTTGSTARPRTSTSIDRLVEVAGERGVPPGAGRARLAAAQARRHGADRRGDEARPPRGRARRGRARADGRGDRAARGAVQAAPRARPLVMMRPCGARRSTAQS